MTGTSAQKEVKDNGLMSWSDAKDEDVERLCNDPELDEAIAVLREALMMIERGQSTDPGSPWFRNAVGVIEKYGRSTDNHG